MTKSINHSSTGQTPLQGIFAIVAGLLCLAIAFVAVTLDEAPRDGRTPQNLWAEAILLSIPYDEMDSATVVNLYLEAIERSDAKAPLLVSLGDFLAGPLCTMEEFNSFTEKVISESNDEFIISGINSIADQMSGGGESMKFFKLALKHDSAYLPALYRMATEGNGIEADDAIKWFCEHQPNNALGWYLRASQAMDEEDFELALEAVERGNLCDQLVTFPPEFPRQFSITYPSIEIYKDVSGKPVPESAVEFLLNRQNDWLGADPLRSSLRGTAWKFIDQATVEAASGKNERAERLCLGCYNLATHMVKCQPVDASLSINGIGLARQAIRTLREIQPSGSSQLELIEQKHRAVENYLHLFRAEYLPLEKELSNAELPEILLGKIRPLAAKREKLIEIRVKSGL